MKHKILLTILLAGASLYGELTEVTQKIFEIKSKVEKAQQARYKEMMAAYDKFGYMHDEELQKEKERINKKYEAMLEGEELSRQKYLHSLLQQGNRDPEVIYRAIVHSDLYLDDIDTYEYISLVADKIACLATVINDIDKRSFYADFLSLVPKCIEDELLNAKLRAEKTFPEREDRRHEIATRRLIAEFGNLVGPTEDIRAAIVEAIKTSPEFKKQVDHYFILRTLDPTLIFNEEELRQDMRYLLVEKDGHTKLKVEAPYSIEGIEKCRNQHH